MYMQWKLLQSAVTVPTEKYINYMKGGFHTWYTVNTCFSSYWCGVVFTHTN